MKRRLVIAFLALFALLTVFGLGIAAAPANATTPPSCKISVVSPLTQTRQSVSGKFSSTCATTIGLAVYGAPGPKFDLKTADQQTFVGVEHIDLPGDGKPVTASATVPDCYFQAEAFIGDVILKLSATNLYGSRLLGPAVNGGSKPCESSTPTPTVPKPHPVPTTTTVNKPHLTTTTTVVGTDHDTGFVPSTTTTTEAPQLASATELPRTGFDYERAMADASWVVGIGALLFIAGIALIPADRPRR
jgi:hypothetical protein